MYFVVDNTKGGGDPSWWLYGENNRMVAWAGRRFPTIGEAKQAALSFKANAKTAVYTYPDEGGHWRWKATRQGSHLASSGESFDSKYNAERAAQNVRENVQYATGL